jgi:uncharacterized protein (PEP-CTERM system associated)
MLPCILTLVASAAGAETRGFSSSISVQETLTNNVNLTSPATGDLVTQVTPSFSINETAARSRLSGTISVPVLLYARTAAENNQAYAQANLLGNVEAIEKFFFIDGAVNVSQQYLTPLGAQPPGLTNATQNRYTSSSYSVSPYIQGGGRGDIQYSIRDDNIWSNLNGTPISLNNSYTNQLSANVGRQAPQLGWLVEYDRTDVRFNSQPPLLSQLGRLTVFNTPDPQLRVSADVGYEDNDYTLSQSRDWIYGVGATWRPTPRTNVDARWEHRFFGSSYLFNFAHNTRLTTWSLSAFRSITSYPQQVASLPGGLEALLNQLFLSTIPDPTQRQSFINQYILEHGLSTVLANPVSVYTQQITLVEQATASIGLLGARNSIVFSAYYLRQRPITASGSTLPGVTNPGSNTTQEGLSVAWTNNLSPNLAFTVSGNAFRTASNVPEGELGFTSPTRQGYVIATLTSPLSAYTSVNGGLRYQVLRTDPASGPGYTEAAIFVGLTHRFH